MIDLYWIISGSFVLSVRDKDEVKGATVKHYKIRNMDNNGGFYIAARRVMTSLPELVSHYKGKVI
jgi:hypothetical protein